MNTSQKKKTERLSKYNIDLLAEANFPRGTTNKMYYPDLGSDVYQYGIFARVSQTSFRCKTTSGIAKYRLFSQFNIF